MSTLPERPRRIVRQPRFERELEQAFSDVRRADEALAGLEWTLSRLPELGMAVRDHPEFSCWPVHTEGPSFLVVYRHSEDEVVLLSIRRVPSTSLG